MTWQLIETAPKDGTRIDVWVTRSGGMRVTDARWVSSRDQWLTLHGYYLVDVTHWMPLPDPPSKEAV